MALGPGDLTWLSGHLVPPILLPLGNPPPPPPTAASALHWEMLEAPAAGRGERRHSAQEAGREGKGDRGEKRQSAQEAGRVGKGDASEAHTLLADGNHFILFSHEFYKVLWQQQESLPMLALSVSPGTSTVNRHSKCPYFDLLAAWPCDVRVKRSGSGGWVTRFRISIFFSYYLPDLGPHFKLFCVSISFSVSYQGWCWGLRQRLHGKGLATSLPPGG